MISLFKFILACQLMLFLAMKCEARDTQHLSRLLLSFGVVEERYNFLKDDIRDMLLPYIHGFKAVRVNEPCEHTSDICIFFIDSSTAANDATLRRYTAIWNASLNNMVAVGPNTILIDATLADMILYSLDIDGRYLSEWLERISNRIGTFKPRGRPWIGDRRSLGDYAHKELLSLRTLALFRKLQNIEYRLYLNVGIEGDEGAETLAKARSKDPNIKYFAAAFLWQLAHEIQHLRQYRGTDADIEFAPLHLSIFASGRRKLEDSADKFAQKVVGNYLWRLRRQKIESKDGDGLWGLSHFGPAGYAELAIGSSLSLWRLIGLRDILHKIRRVPFRDLFFRIVRAPCDEYSQHVKENGIKKPDRIKQSIIDVDPSNVIEISLRSEFLLTAKEIEQIRSRLSSAMSNGSHPFSYQRVESMLEDLSKERRPSAAWAADKQFLDHFFARMTGRIANRAGDDVAIRRPTHITYVDFISSIGVGDKQANVKVMPADNCVSDNCEIIEVTDEEGLLSLFEVGYSKSGSIVFLLFKQRVLPGQAAEGAVVAPLEIARLKRILTLLTSARSNVLFDKTVKSDIFMSRIKRYSGSDEYLAEAMIEEVRTQSFLCEWGNVRLILWNVEPNVEDSYHLLLSSSPDSPFYLGEFFAYQDASTLEPR